MFQRFLVEMTDLDELLNIGMDVPHGENVTHAEASNSENYG